MKQSTQHLIAILVLILAFCFVSCSDSGTKKVRARSLSYYASTGYYLSTTVQFIDVDTMAHSGDTLYIANKYTTYVIE